ncbi:type II toxin-antitoxin system RelE/ParE family toxin, partial [Vibrio splendidus]
NKPGWRLHQLNPKKDDIWAIDVNGNWRVTFQFRNGNAFILDYRDYH